MAERKKGEEIPHHFINRRGGKEKKKHKQRSRIKKIYIGGGEGEEKTHSRGKEKHPVFSTRAAKEKEEKGKGKDRPELARCLVTEGKERDLEGGKKISNILSEEKKESAPQFDALPAICEGKGGKERGIYAKIYVFPEEGKRALCSTWRRKRKLGKKKKGWISGHLGQEGGKEGKKKRGYIVGTVWRERGRRKGSTPIKKKRKRKSPAETQKISSRIRRKKRRFSPLTHHAGREWPENSYCSPPL